MGEFRIILTPRADADLEEIYQHIAGNSADHAARMVTRLLDEHEPLKQFPYRTVFEQRHADLRHPVRKIVVRPYVIHFHVYDEQKAVRVVHIRHGARRPPRID